VTKLKDRSLCYLVTYRKARQCVVVSLFGAKAFKKASKVNKVRLSA